MEKEDVFVVRLLVKYEGQYFVGVFTDEEIMRKRIGELKTEYKGDEYNFVIDTVKVNEGEVRYF
jgi:hypothetical protein